MLKKKSYLKEKSVKLLSFLITFHFSILIWYNISNLQSFSSAIDKQTFLNVIVYENRSIYFSSELNVYIFGHLVWNTVYYLRTMTLLKYGAYTLLIIRSVFY